MFVGIEFATDTNKTLKEVQHTLYGEMVGRIFDRSRNRYLDACQLAQVETELAERLHPMTHFDHRTLQGTYLA